MPEGTPDTRRHVDSSVPPSEQSLKKKILGDLAHDLRSGVRSGGASTANLMGIHHSFQACRILIVFDSYIAQVEGAEREKRANSNGEETTADTYRELKQEIEDQRTQFFQLAMSILKLHDQRGNDSASASISLREVEATFSRMKTAKDDTGTLRWTDCTDWDQTLSSLQKLRDATVSQLQGRDTTGLDLATPSLNTYLTASDQ